LAPTIAFNKDSVTEWSRAINEADELRQFRDGKASEATVLEFIREHEAETLIWSSVGDIWFVKTYFKQFLTYHKQQFLVMETITLSDDEKE